MVEGAIGLPILIIAIIALSLIVRIIGVCENIGFVSVKEMRDISVSAATNIGSGTLCKVTIEGNVYDETPELTDFKVTRVKYLHTKDELEDLISIDSKANFTVSNPMGIKGKIEFKLDIMARAFTGMTQDSTPLPRGEFIEKDKSKIVTIFPKYGIRFHTKNCRYVKQEYPGEEYKLEMEREDAEAKGYTPCLVCKGGGK